MKQQNNWFEIPATDFDRALSFYEQVFMTKPRRDDHNNILIKISQNSESNSSGPDCHKPQLKLGTNGTVIYLNVEEDLAPLLARVEVYGGRVVLDKMLIRDDIGHIGMFRDSEGNLIGVHAPVSKLSIAIHRYEEPRSTMVNPLLLLLGYL